LRWCRFITSEGPASEGPARVRGRRLLARPRGRGALADGRGWLGMARMAWDGGNGGGGARRVGARLVACGGEDRLEMRLGGTGRKTGPSGPRRNASLHSDVPPKRISSRSSLCACGARGFSVGGCGAGLQSAPVRRAGFQPALARRAGGLVWDCVARGLALVPAGARVLASVLVWRGRLRVGTSEPPAIEGLFLSGFVCFPVCLV